MNIRTDLSGLHRPIFNRAAGAALLTPRIDSGRDGPIGRVSQPLTGAFLPAGDWSGVPHFDQGSQSSCGTTSLRMVLQYLTGRSPSQGEIDDAIRRGDFGTAPADLKRYAQEQGVPAGMYNHSSIDEMKSHIAKGRAVMVSLDNPYSNGSDGGFKDHYVIVTGFEVKDGKEFVKIRDPNGDNNGNINRLGGNADYSMPIEEFQQKWGAETEDGFKNFMMVYGRPGESLPADRLDGMETSIAMSSALMNTVNNFDRVISPENVGVFAHGLIGGIGAVGSLLPTGVGWGLNWLGNKLDKFSKGLPFPLSAVGIPVASVLRAGGVALAEIGAGFSNGADRLGGAFGSLFKGDFKGFGVGLFNAGKEVASGLLKGAVGAGKALVNGAKDVAEGAVNAVKDAGKAIASGVKKIFSGW